MVSGTLDGGGRILLIRVKGNLLSTNAESRAQSIGEILDRERDSGWKELHLDLRSARIVDSVGLNVIMELVRKLEAGEKSGKILISSPAIQRVFLFSRLDTLVKVVFKERRER